MTATRDKVLWKKSVRGDIYVYMYIYVLTHRLRIDDNRYGKRAIAESQNKLAFTRANDIYMCVFFEVMAWTA